LQFCLGLEPSCQLYSLFSLFLYIIINIAAGASLAVSWFKKKRTGKGSVIFTLNCMN
jgi:hypothetical protein